MTLDRHIGLLLIGAGLGLFIAAFLVPPDPVDEKYVAYTMREIFKILGPLDEGANDEIMKKRAIEEAIANKASETARKLNNWGFGFLVAGVGVMVLAGAVRHYWKSPCSLPGWLPWRNAVIDRIEARKRERES